MDEEHIQKIKEILTQWNPLGERANQISDLNDYETEAVDIIFNIDIEVDFKKTKDPSNRVRIIVKEVLNEAFDLWLTDKECDKPTKLIFNILN